MSTFLLAWNSRRWQWDDLAKMSSMTKMGNHVPMRWSCGKSKRLEKGDRVFWIRLGQKPRGIFASGVITKGAYEDTHWDEERAAIGETALFVQVQIDTLLNPDIDTLLPRAILKAPPFAEMHWDTQMSGVQIPDSVATELERVWASFTIDNGFVLPEEIEEAEKIHEGALRQILVNAYERNPEARRRCIAYYGCSCFVCEFDFEATYGEVGKDYIHVHHLKQLSEIGGDYLVDPIHDLRPVCPNCHAIIHRRKPAYSIEEVKLFLQGN